MLLSRGSKAIKLSVIFFFWGGIFRESSKILLHDLTDRQVSTKTNKSYCLVGKCGDSDHNTKHRGVCFSTEKKNHRRYINSTDLLRVILFYSRPYRLYCIIIYSYIGQRKWFFFF